MLLRFHCPRTGHGERQRSLEYGRVGVAVLCKTLKHGKDSLYRAYTRQRRGDGGHAPAQFAVFLKPEAKALEMRHIGQQGGILGRRELEVFGKQHLLRGYLPVGELSHIALVENTHMRTVL